MSGIVEPIMNETYETYADRLTRVLGPIVGGGELSKALGYRSQAAFRQAVARNRLPVPVFTCEGRRGRFACTTDIAIWIWNKRSHLPRTEATA
jgi:hypothetical protein